MYESPIKAYISEVKTQFDSAVFRAVQNVGIDVDKNELVKALAYDRDQYERGYHDGLMFHPAIVTNADRVRAMADEELADWACNRACSLCRIPGCEGRMEVGREACRERWLDWLRQEATDGT